MTALSLHAAIMQYLDALRSAGAAEGTIDHYRSVLLRLHRQYSDRQLNGMTHTDLAQFLYGPQGISVGKAKSTDSKHRAALSSLFGYAHQMGWMRQPPAIPKQVLRSKKTRPLRETAPTRLTAQQLQLMVGATSEPIVRCMLIVAMQTALRVSDVCKIQVKDIDFQAGDLYVWIQKTGEFDAFPITQDLEEALREYLQWYSRTVPIGPDDYLFPGWKRAIGRQADNGGPAYDPDPSKCAQYDWALKRLHAVLGECGIRVERSEAWHVIRRSVARIYFDSMRQEMSHDHALRQTASLLHHKKVETTERYLGMQAEIRARNESLRGQRFILTSPHPVITPLRKVK